MNNVRPLPKQPIKPMVRPEPPSEPAGKNLQKPSTEGTVQLQFQVPAEIRRAVKSYAAERDLNMSELFVKMWEQYRTNNV